MHLLLHIFRTGLQLIKALIFSHVFHLRAYSGLSSHLFCIANAQPSGGAAMGNCEAVSPQRFLHRDSVWRGRAMSWNLRASGLCHRLDNVLRNPLCLTLLWAAGLQGRSPEVPSDHHPVTVTWFLPEFVPKWVFQVWQNICQEHRNNLGSSREISCS